MATIRGIGIRGAFQGDVIGDFIVLSPHRSAYLHLVESEKTPVPATGMAVLLDESVSRAEWGEENLKGDT